MISLKEPLQPLRSRVFRRLLGAVFVNTMGDAVGLVALSILIYERSGTPLGLVLLFVLKQFAPGLVAPAVASKLDAFPARTSLVFLYGSNAVAYALLAIGAQGFPLEALFALAFIDGLLTVSGRSVVRGTTATVLRSEGRLRAGNALVNNVVTIAYGVGPLIGGLLAALLGISAALFLDAGSFVLAAAVLATVATLPSVEKAGDGWWAHLRKGLGYIRRQPHLRLLFGVDAISLMFLTMVLPIEVVLAKGTFGVGNAEFGLFIAAWGIGMGIGGGLFTLERRSPLGAVIVLGCLIQGMAYVGVGAAPTFALATFANLLGGIGNGVQIPALFTALQNWTPATYQVRVATASESAAAIMTGLGYVLGGVVATAASARTAFLVAGLGAMLVVTIAWQGLRRLIDKQPRSMDRNLTDAYAPPPALRGIDPGD